MRAKLTDAVHTIRALCVGMIVPGVRCPWMSLARIYICIFSWWLIQVCNDTWFSTYVWYEYLHVKVENIVYSPTFGKQKLQH